MGKPKNKNKKGQDEEFEDEIDQNVLNATEEDSKPASKGKKKKGKRKDDDWEDDVAAEIAALSVDNNKGDPDELNGTEVPAPVPKKKEKKKKKKVESDDDEMDKEEIEVTAKTGTKKSTKGTFQLLMQDDSDSDHGSEDENVEEEAPTKPVDSEPVKENKKKKDKKKDKKKEQQNEDIDAILANLDKPAEKSKKKKKNKGEDTSAAAEDEQAKETVTEMEVDLEAKMQNKVVTMEDLEDDDEDVKKKRKKKGKEQKKEESVDKDEEEGEGEVAEGEEGSTMKTAAQKRKEKRDREKQKKLQEKKKQKQTPKSTEEGEASVAAKEEQAEGEEKAEGDDEEKEGKKKKGKKGEKEEKKRKTKAPVALIKAQLEKLKEEEERLKREEEERIRKEEEEIRRKEEEKRLEQEKRDRKKQKEKEKKERLKAEGKLLTEKQKQDRRRAMQMLEQMKAQGIEVPQKDEVHKKRPVYFDRKKKKGGQQREDSPQVDVEGSPSPVDETPVETPTEVEDKVVTEAQSPTQEEAQEVEWDDEDDVKDAWDVESDSEEEEEKKEEKPMETDKAVEREVSEEKEEDEDESEDDEEDEESEEEEESESEEEESESESEEEDGLTAIEKAREKIMKRKEEAEKKRSTDVLRAPVVCVLGHVDTGKTKILDKLRRTHVQDGEAGGITQQIGATNVPEQAIREHTKMCKEFQKITLKVPGLLIIDTPGHESFSNLRSRGSSLCDIAILVVDIMHGLEPQTIESINLLKQRKTPFVIALNKVDRIYQWKPMPHSDIVNAIKKQTPQARSEYDTRCSQVIVQMAEQGLNAAMFYENKNQKEFISIVPTSAHTGDGMGNLIALICELTQTMLAKRISYSEELQATVMEVKSLHGLGTTVDVILVNGKLKEGDLVIVPGTEGPIVTQIRGLLMPQPMRELRVKSQWEHHKEVHAAQGVKLIAKDFEKALAGLPMYVAESQDEVEYYKEELSQALKEVLSSIKLTERGVFVQASTLGSLEALLEFLRTSKIPYAGINIGPVHRKDIMKASIMLEHDTQYAVILAFDVKVEREAQELADSLGVTIFTADIIYHLFDRFTEYRAKLKKTKQEEFKHIAVFPCKLRVLPQYVFNSRDPIVVGVMVEAGFIKEGTPLCVPSKEFLEIGRVTSVENNHKPVDMARKGMEVCIKVEATPGETPKMFGRHFDETDMVVSKISRESIDAVKDYFREDMQKSDWQLMLELKKTFRIL